MSRPSQLATVIYFGPCPEKWSAPTNKYFFTF